MTICYTYPHLHADGITQMALDEALAQWVRQQKDVLVMLVRTYTWCRPTLSLGVHQQLRDVERAYHLYTSRLGESPDLVYRPTGGRAILHGEDISYAVITNDPDLLKASIHDSYLRLMQPVAAALKSLGVPLRDDTQTDAGSRDYLRSPLCFQTQTPSDLLTISGKKVTGAAQMRKSGVILQHGAAFLSPWPQAEAAFESSWQSSVAESLQTTLIPLDEEQQVAVQKTLEKLKPVYQAKSEATLARLATTSGSHFEPASP